MFLSQKVVFVAILMTKNHIDKPSWLGAKDRNSRSLKIRPKAEKLIKFIRQQDEIDNYLRALKTFIRFLTQKVVLVTILRPNKLIF